MAGCKRWWIAGCLLAAAGGCSDDPASEAPSDPVPAEGTSEDTPAESIPDDDVAAQPSECQVDLEQTGYALAESYDDCLAWQAQRGTAGIDATAIEIRASETTPSDLGSQYATLDGEAGWVQTHYAFLSEDLSAYPDAPGSIDSVLLVKMKTAASVDRAFGRPEATAQGLCVQVQQQVHDTVLNSVLTASERERYLAEGAKLSFLPDDDPPPLDATTNPLGLGQVWLVTEPSSHMTSDSEGYYYEPLAMLYDTGDEQDSDSQVVGVRYCKLLTHQSLLSWMRSKSFESDPVLLTPPAAEECSEPKRTQTTAGSCLFYFALSDFVYCSDYVGTAHDTDSAQEICSKVTREDSVYSTEPCSARIEEIQARIPDYEGLVGACVIRCGQPDEFLWNVYEGELGEHCVGFPQVTAERLSQLPSE